MNKVEELLIALEKNVSQEALIQARQNVIDDLKGYAAAIEKGNVELLKFKGDIGQIMKFFLNTVHMLDSSDIGKTREAFPKIFMRDLSYEYLRQKGWIWFLKPVFEAESEISRFTCEHSGTLLARLQENDQKKAKLSWQPHARRLRPF
ncbi:MAG: hypothetical protein LBF22_04180 [Deltaproteobacteria bacterium]|jgi:hypothetical protein|nr:hypothetical protein [Deltaproteobacteria bacterium]